jgi:hypothetical protein
VLLSISIIFISEDFRYNHLVNIDSKEINFRLVYNETLTDHYYPRWDTKTPSEFIKNNSKPEDIIISNQSQIDYYLNRLDYMYINYTEGRFYSTSLLHGTKERWTNAGLIWNEKDLVEKINSSSSVVWLIGLERILKKLSFYNELKKYFIFEGVDKTIKVLKIPAKENLSLKSNDMYLLQHR